MVPENCSHRCLSPLFHFHRHLERFQGEGAQAGQGKSCIEIRGAVAGFVVTAGSIADPASWRMDVVRTVGKMQSFPFPMLDGDLPHCNRESWTLCWFLKNTCITWLCCVPLYRIDQGRLFLSISILNMVLLSQRRDAEDISYFPSSEGVYNDISML